MTTSDDLGVGCFNADLGGPAGNGGTQIDVPVFPPKTWEIGFISQGNTYQMLEN